MELSTLSDIFSFDLSTTIDEVIQTVANRIISHDRIKEYALVIEENYDSSSSRDNNNSINRSSPHTNEIVIVLEGDKQLRYYRLKQMVSRGRACIYNNYINRYPLRFSLSNNRQHLNCN